MRKFIIKDKLEMDDEQDEHQSSTKYLLTRPGHLFG